METNVLKGTHWRTRSISCKGSRLAGRQRSTSWGHISKCPSFLCGLLYKQLYRFVYTSIKSQFLLILSNEAAQTKQRISVTTEVGWVFCSMLTNNYIIEICQLKSTRYHLTFTSDNTEVTIFFFNLSGICVKYNWNTVIFRVLMSSSLADICDLTVYFHQKAYSSQPPYESMIFRVFGLACIAVKHFHNRDIFWVRTLGPAIQLYVMLLDGYLKRISFFRSLNQDQNYNQNNTMTDI